MPTNDERREVAKKLRERTKRPMGKSMQRMFTETLGMYTYNVCWMNPDKATSRWDAIVNYLANLIEPEPERTCRIYDTDHGFEDSIRCDACQMTFRRPWQPFKFCPNCGAKVVPDE